MMCLNIMDLWVTMDKIASDERVVLLLRKYDPGFTDSLLDDLLLLIKR